MMHPYRQGKIKLLARTQRPIILQFGGEEYPPGMTEYGAPTYDVPYAYAERLIDGDQAKYALLAPSSIEIKMAPIGEKYRRQVALKAVVPVKNADGDVLRHLDGFPIYANPDDVDAILRSASDGRSAKKTKVEKEVTGKKNKIGVKIDKSVEEIPCDPVDDSGLAGL
jgi:hypothetical protein